MTISEPWPTAKAGPWRALTIGLFIVGAVASTLRRTDVDVAWLLTLGEKMLAGQRPYIDLFEANPPMSILLYLPAVLLGRITGVAPEVMVNVLVLAASAVSLALCGRILARAIDDRATLWKLGAAGVFVLAVLPTGVFSQREHIAIIAMLPFLALAIARGGGARVEAVLSGLAGLGCGIAMAVKPHFALVAGPSVLVTAWRLRSWRPFVALEIWTASLVVALYGLTLVTLFPAFLGFLPVIRETYLPARRPWSTILALPPVPVWVVLGGLACWTARPGSRAAWAAASLFAASAGGVASYLIQAKGWPYHSYPMLALSLLALAVAMCLAAPREGGAAKLFGVGGLACVMVVLTMQWFTLKGDYHDLNAPVEAIAARPKVLSITADIALGHPLTREVQGHWVGSVCSQWISAGALALERRGGLSAGQRARLDSLMTFDRRLLTSDIHRGRPDVILIQTSGFDWGAWAKADLALASALGAYEPLETIEGVTIWARKDRPRRHPA